ncbi:MAG: heavy metal-binding domain-containing protein [Gemmobacter sp.]
MPVTLSTAPPDAPHEVLDIVGAIGTTTGGAFSGGPRLSDALDDCKANLRARAEELGADAVVSCGFETTYDSRSINIAAYGTAVKWR